MWKRGILGSGGERGMTIASSGEDGKEGTDDDIKSW
jgi:hypothetical protein